MFVPAHLEGSFWADWRRMYGVCTGEIEACLPGALASLPAHQTVTASLPWCCAAVGPCSSLSQTCCWLDRADRRHPSEPRAPSANAVDRATHVHVTLPVPTSMDAGEPAAAAAAAAAAPAPAPAMGWILPASAITLGTINIAEQLKELSLPIHINDESGTPLQLFGSAAITIVSSTAAAGAQQRKRGSTAVADPAGAWQEPRSKSSRTRELQQPGVYPGAVTGEESFLIPTDSPDHAAGVADDPGLAAAKHHVIDCTFYTGGTVWCMDWCPLPPAALAQPATTRPPEVLAVAVHPKSHQRNRVGRATSGPAHIQLWRVPTAGSSDSSTFTSVLLPTPLAALPHEGGVTWAAKWCPNPSAFLASAAAAAVDGSSSSSSNSSAFHDEGVWPQQVPADCIPVQGLLAAVLGSGDVVVWLVPSTTYLQQAAAHQAAAVAAAAAPSTPGEGDTLQDPAPALASVSPAVLVTLTGAGDMLGSLPSCVEWCPEAPHDKLLMGCWDGKVAIWKLPLTPGGQPEMLMLSSLCSSPVRCVQWRPPAARSSAHGNSSSSSSCSSNMYFITGSQQGDMDLWDSADTQQPLMHRMLTRSAVNACAWTANPESLLFAMANGELRQTSLDVPMLALCAHHRKSTSYNHVGDVPNCLWSVSACHHASVMAYVGDAGVVGVGTIDPMTSDFRSKRPHVALGAMVVEQGEVWFLRHDQLEGNAGLPLGGRGLKGAAGTYKHLSQAPVWQLVPHASQALYSVTFSRSSAPSVLLASGGAAGLVRVQRVAASLPA